MRHNYIVCPDCRDSFSSVRELNAHRCPPRVPSYEGVAKRFCVLVRDIGIRPTATGPRTVTIQCETEQDITSAQQHIDVACRILRVTSTVVTNNLQLQVALQ